MPKAQNTTAATRKITFFFRVSIAVIPPMARDGSPSPRELTARPGACCHRFFRSRECGRPPSWCHRRRSSRFLTAALPVNDASHPPWPALLTRRNSVGLRSRGPPGAGPSLRPASIRRSPSSTTPPSPEPALPRSALTLAASSARRKVFSCNRRRLFPALPPRPALLRAVSMRTGTEAVCRSALSLLQTSHPSIFGSMRSRITRSGLREKAFSRASSPSAAEAVSYPCRRRSGIRTPSTMASSSSTISISLSARSPLLRAAKSGGLSRSLCRCRYRPPAPPRW